MSEQIQRDIELLDALLRTAGWPREEEAWQRIRARLSPDREAVAEGIYTHAAVPGDRAWELLDERAKTNWLALADAAIAAMQRVKS